MFKKFFNKKKPETQEPEGQKRSNEPWPLTPPRHAEDKHYQYNQFDAFGIYQLVFTKINKEREIEAVNLYSVVLMENGYGERFATILKNGVLVMNFVDTNLVRSTEDWNLVIRPWLENKTDFLPSQDGILAADISEQVRRIEKSMRK